MHRTLARAATAAMFAAGCLFLAAAHGAVPMAKAQAPAHYRMMLGDFEVTALSDGTLGLPVAKILTNTIAARNGYWVGAAHIAFRGLGHLRAEGNGYVWIPANYTSLR